MADDGTIELVNGRTLLRYMRRLEHPIGRVWRAVTEPDELRHWFPASRIEVDLRVGGRMRFFGPDESAGADDGEVLVLDPPRLFAFNWDTSGVRIELEPAAEGCLLRFTHDFGVVDLDTQGLAPFRTGWHVGLDLLETWLAGQADEDNRRAREAAVQPRYQE